MSGFGTEIAALLNQPGCLTTDQAVVLVPTHSARNMVMLRRPMNHAAVNIFVTRPTHFIVSRKDSGPRGEIQVLFAGFNQPHAQPNDSGNRFIVQLAADQIEGETPRPGDWLLPLDKSGQRYRVLIQDDVCAG